LKQIELKTTEGRETNHLEKQTENQSVVGIVIIKGPLGSTEESELSYEVSVSSGGADQRVRGPTLTTKFEKLINSICGVACPQKKFHILEALR